MNIEILENNILDQFKNGVKDLELDKSFDDMNKEVGNVIVNALDKAANYVIKAMPIPDSLKDILKDVKKALKTKDFKGIVNTAINSSIREGLEAIGISKSSITSITKLKDILQKGGILQGIKNCVEILAKNYLKNNIVGNYVYEFFEKLKQTLMSKNFKSSVYQGIDKSAQKAESFIEKCRKWYESYEKSDFNTMNGVAQDLGKKISGVKWSADCMKENKTIQNITELVRDKKEKLSNYQLQLCKSM